jgi:hypothetical protein
VQRRTLLRQRRDGVEEESLDTLLVSSVAAGSELVVLFGNSLAELQVGVAELQLSLYAVLWW